MKNTLSFFAFLFFSSALFSQNISFGINGGLCIAEQTFSPPPNTTLDPVDTAPKFGLSTGGYIVFHLHKNIAIRSGFYFEQKGERYKDVQFTDENGNPTDEGTIKKNVNYWQVPILMEFSGGKTINWFVNGGYAYGRLTKAELKYHRAIIDNQRTFDIKYTYLDDDHSIVFGGGGCVSPFRLRCR